MSKTFVGLILLVFVLGLAQASLAAWDPNTDPALIGRWKCDEGQGSTVSDSGPGGHHGTFVEGNPAWTTGVSHSAIKLAYPTLVEVPAMDLKLTHATMAGWVLPSGAQSDWASFIMHRGPGPAHGFNLLGDRRLAYHWNDDAASWNYRGNAYYAADEWTHCAVVVEPTKATFYVNGVSASVNTIAHAVATWDGPIWLGGDRTYTDGSRHLNGALDDVMFFSRALTAAEVKSLVPPKLKARKPTPADGAVGIMMPLLQWTPGETSVFDDVYLGTTSELTAADLVKHQSSFVKMYFHMVPPLTPGVKYYWRVDSTDATGKLIATGDVWSFTLAPVIAYDPVPANGARYQSVDVNLVWTAGQNAMKHEVYFGTNQDDVANGAAGVSQGSVAINLLELPALTEDTTYYWRVDEIDATGSKKVGDVWSFTTRPVIAKVPGLVGWWKLEDENSGTAVDYSGWGNDGALLGGPTWVDGYQGGGMEFDGQDDYVDTHYATDLATWTVSCWVTSPQAPSGAAATGPVHREKNFQINWNHGTAADRGAAGLCIGGTWYFASFGNLSGNTWYHLAATFDGTTLKTYVNGEQTGINGSATGTPDAETGTLTFGKHSTAANFFTGTVDDVRLYDVALSPDEVKETMRGDPLLAWDPRPMSGFTADIRDAGTLTWSAGEGAANHDVYIGKDKAAVRDAGTGSPEYKGRQAGTSYATAGVVEFGGGTYFWRIDEVEADGATIHRGSVWSFTVPDFLLVDDFESYVDAVEGRIFQTWIDGWGFTEPEPGNPGNGTGSTVGYTDAPFAEQSIIHGGRQSMPFDYNNIIQPYYSETDRTWAAVQNWTLNDVDTLSLWFQGYGARYLDDGTTITISAAGDDIWNNADAFRFVYKRLSGDGSITVKVNSIVQTNAWAKAGVMIRESLASGSANAANIVSAASGVSFQYRPFADDVSANVGQTGLKAPYWVRLTRTGNTFKAEASADGKTWSIIGTDATLSSHDVTMGGSIYIGLCVTSHNTNAKIATTGVFSDVKTTGGVSGQWQVADVGMVHPGNDAAPLYVALQDSAGKVAVVNHPDANATLTTAWAEWQIPLSQFTGVNTKSIKKMFIGVGDRKAPQADGAGKLFIDDIRVIKPAPAGQ